MKSAPAHHVNENRKTCPQCGSEKLHDFIRQYPEHKGVADVGWKCDNCCYEFGFELSEPSFPAPRTTP